MVMTEFGLLFIGSLATLATLGIFYDFRDADGKPDRATSVLVAFLASVLWGGFGLSASDVIVRDTSFANASEPIEPLFWLGVLMALLVGSYAIYGLFKAFYHEATEGDAGLIQ